MTTSPPPKKPAKPFDFAKEFESFAYRSKGNHETAGIFANAKGTWIVTPHSHSFEGKEAEKRARAYFESLRTDCPVTGTRKESSKPASKPSLGEWVPFAESNPPKGYKFQAYKWIFTESTGRHHWVGRGYFAGESKIAKESGCTHWLAIPTPPEPPEPPKSHA